MKIFATGTEDRLDEFRKIIPESNSLTCITYEKENNSNERSLAEFDLVLDLNLDEHAERINRYSQLQNKIVVVGAVKKSLKEISGKAKGKIACHLIGFNSLPTFINRTQKEISFSNSMAKEKFSSLAQQLNWNWLEVKDETGMVTPRVISMIINEASFTLYEGTASKEDIDKGMKLGTAYPMGPLEWADKIGIKNVCETLEAIHNETKEERYKISPLLKSMYLSGKQFYH